MFSESIFHNIFECKDCEYKIVVRFDDCCRKPFQVVVVDTKLYPNPRIYEQCVHCGGVMKNRPLKHKIFSESIRGEFNDGGYEKWREDVSNDRINVQKYVSYWNYLTSPKGKYHEYLNSENWKIKRKEVLDRDNYTCKICNVNAAVHVHHLTYSNIFHEHLEDLISIRAECHSKNHKEEFVKRIGINY